MKELSVRKILISITIILFFQGCTSKVEIPIKHVGVVKSAEQINNEVLMPGEHLISFGAEVIVYDVRPVTLEVEFDFLFSDASEGNMKVAIEFNPIVDSLAAFYRKYQSIYVTPIVDQGTRKVARNVFMKYKSIDLTKEEFELEILKAIKGNHAIRNYVEMKKVDIMELRY